MAQDDSGAVDHSSITRPGPTAILAAMYEKFFGLAREAFSIAPDPRFLFMSERHREALAHLLYGLSAGGGFVLLTGEIGAGKTTVCRCFLEQVPSRCNVAYIFNPELTVVELLQSVCDELHVAYRQPVSGVATVKDYLDPLNESLLKTHAEGRDSVLIIDEAQRLSAGVLEQLRLLTNLETSERKLLQIILIGQPELRVLLARPELEQLAQRVIARYHLDALSELETTQYIAHRLAVAGLGGANPFKPATMRLIYRLTRGVPRRINLLCDRALLGAYSRGDASVSRAVVAQAAREVFAAAHPASRTRPAWRWVASGAALAAVLAGATTLALNRPPTSNGRAAAVGAPAPPAKAASVLVTAAAASVGGFASGAASDISTAQRPAGSDGTPASTLDAVLATSWRSESLAWRELAPAWGLIAAEGDTCVAAERHGVRCFSGARDLNLIRRLERPGFLVLRAKDGTSSYALLVRLTAQDATLQVSDGKTHRLPLMALASVWQGEFATLWRLPPGYRAMLVDGNEGPAVDWLAARLAQVQGLPAPPTGQRFDASLKAQVRNFQVAQGLLPDGIAGPTTFMQINRATGVDEPRLPLLAASGPTPALASR